MRKESDNQKRIKLIEEYIKKYRYVKEQIERFGNALKEELSIATLSIEQNMLEAKIDYYKNYYYPRKKQSITILSTTYQCFLKL